MFSQNASLFSTSNDMHAIWTIELRYRAFLPKYSFTFKRIRYPVENAPFIQHVLK